MHIKTLIFYIYRSPISIECLAPFGGPVEPGIAVGGYPNVQTSKCFQIQIC